MEAAALFALGELRGVAVGCALAITDLLAGPRERIDAAALHEAGLAVGRLGAAALAGGGSRVARGGARDAGGAARRGRALAGGSRVARREAARRWS